MCVKHTKSSILSPEGARLMPYDQQLQSCIMWILFVAQMSPKGRRIEPNNIIGARRAYFWLHFDWGPKGHWPRYTLYYHDQISFSHPSMQGNKNNEKILKNEVFMNFEKKILHKLFLSSSHINYHTYKYKRHVCLSTSLIHITLSQVKWWRRAMTFWLLLP